MRYKVFKQSCRYNVIKLRFGYLPTALMGKIIIMLNNENLKAYEIHKTFV